MTFVLQSGAPEYPRVRRDGRWGLPVYTGQRLPPALAAFAAPRHSWEFMVQDIINERQPVPGPVRPRPDLRAYQRPRVEEMRAAHASGAPGYLLAYPTGSGKTSMAVNTVLDLPVSTVLVVTKLSVVPAFRATIDYFGAGEQRWVVINPEQLWRLFEHPWLPLGSLPADEAAQIAAASGHSRVAFGAVVTDESHILADPASNRSRLHYRLMHPEQGPRPWWLRMSATPFSTPSETAYASDLIAHVAGVEEPEDLAKSEYLDWLRDLGFALNMDATGRWFHQVNEHDVGLVEQLLYTSGVGATATPEQLGLPSQTRELRPVDLSPAEGLQYEQAWAEFRQANGLETVAASDEESSGGRSSALRRVQRASYLKAPYVARIVADLVGRGYQVAVPTWYLDSVHALAVHIARELKALGLPDKVGEITGEAPGLRERIRRAFQLGRCLVVVVNALEGINLHAGERDVDGQGHDATSAPRASVIADVLTGGRRTLQAEGRTQRDGQHSIAVYVYARGTTEEAWLERCLRAAASTQALAQSAADAEALSELADQLDPFAGSTAEAS